MSDVIPFAPRSTDNEMIVKLISAGYLQPNNVIILMPLRTRLPA
jgi:hypothetical protein